MNGIEWVLLGHVAIGAVVLMAALWLVHKRIADAGVVDVGWSFGLGAAAVYFALTADGEPWRRAIIGVLGGFWGFRLAWHLLTDRVLGGEEDGRYQELREQWGEKFVPRMFWFFEAQALLVVLLSVPFLLAASDTSAVGAFALAGVGVWVIGFVGESIADMQLKRFKRKPESKGKTCREGLWRYSRHPNYFFEWLMWVAYGVLALGAPLGWLGLLAPALMLLLITKVTGIPPTEKRAIRSRGEDYRRYQRETSAFFPLPPREASA